MPKILFFSVEISLSWYSREVFLLSAPMRRLSEKLVMGAHGELNCQKCQQSGKSTEFWQKNEEIQKRHGCTQEENQCHSPTPGNNRKMSEIDHNRTRGYFEARFFFLEVKWRLEKWGHEWLSGLWMRDGWARGERF